MITSLLMSTAGVLGTLAQSAATEATRLPAPPYRPFIDPLELHSVWWGLLIPMALGIALVYKAVRLPTMKGYVRGVVIFSLQIILGMLALAVASYLVVEWFVPMALEW